MTPDHLLLTARLTPSSPSLTEFGGHFSVSVSVQNPDVTPGRVRLWTPDGLSACSFGFILQPRDGSSGYASQCAILNDSVLVLGPHEDRTYVFEADFINAASPFSTGEFGLSAKFLSQQKSVDVVQIRP